MDFAALEKRQRARADRLDQLHPNVRIALCILVEKGREYRFHLHGRGSDPQHTGVAATQLLGLLAQGCDRTQQAPATAEQLLSRTGQEEPAADAVEQGQAELLLQIVDLP